MMLSRYYCFGAASFLIKFARTVVEQAFAEHILPLPVYIPSQQNSKIAEVDEAAWTDRMLNVMRYLSDQAIKALSVLSNIRLP